MSNPIYELFNFCYRCGIKYPKFVICCLECGHRVRTRPRRPRQHTPRL